MSGNLSQSITEVPEETICPYCGTQFPLISDCMMHIFEDHPDKYVEWLKNDSSTSKIREDL